MTQPKPLTYDEHKAAEAAFRGYLPNPEWTESAHQIYVRLSAAMTHREPGSIAPNPEHDLEEVNR